MSLVSWHLMDCVVLVTAVDVKNVPGKIKNVKKRIKRGKNKKRLKTMNKKGGHNLFNLLPNA